MNYWNDEVYSKGLQFNNWPYIELLSIVNSIKDPQSTRETLLEIGCGVGNNLIPLVGIGLECSGIDISTTAINEARSRAKKLGIDLNLLVGDIQNLSFKDASFHYVVDRSVITCLDEGLISKAISEVHRVLKPRGYFVAVDWFGSNHPDLKFGKKVSNYSYSGFKSGNFRNVDTITVFDFNRINKLFAGFETYFIKRHRTTNYRNAIVDERYSLVMQKP